MAGEEGIEPSSLVLETSILPLNYSPLRLSGEFCSPLTDLFGFFM